MNENRKLWAVDSIAEQCNARGWWSDIIDFRNGIKQGWDFFNPSIIDRPDGRWLIVRRSKRVDEVPIGMNDVLAFIIRHGLPDTGWKLDCGARFEGEHFEDPRGCYCDGMTVVATNNFFMPTPKTWTGAHQIFSEFTGGWRLKRRHDIDYDGNGTSIGKRKKPQKNWLPFFSNSKLHIVYWASPHTILEMSPDMTSMVRVHKSPNDLSVWEYGEIRGGTPPVLYNGLYWTFFHSSLPWQGGKRQFHMGAYAFEPHPPFSITKITPEPLLSGSKRDRWYPGKPLVVFPGGAVMDDSTWLVVYGVNDLDCGWCKIPHADVESACVDVGKSCWALEKRGAALSY